MKAIILAAGRGSRMGQETESKPKCHTQLLGKRLLDWQIEALHAGGIENVSVVKGYKSELMVGDFTSVENHRWAETNMVYSLFCNETPETSCIISYSDIVYRPDHIRQLAKASGDIVITADRAWESLWRVRFEDPTDDAETFKYADGKLLEIGKKTNDISDIEAQYMGLLKISPKGWEIMKAMFDQLPAERQDKLDMTSMLNLLLENKQDIQVEFISGGWCEVDSYEDVLAYEEVLKKTPEWSHDWRV